MKQTHTLTKHIPSSRNTLLLLLVSIIPLSMGLTGCTNSEQKKCIDRQSHLWNPKADTREENKRYWDAVERCKEKY